MKRALLILVPALVALAADKKPLPNQAGNDDVDLTGALMTERQEIRDALGAELGPGYFVVRVKVMPKTDMPLRVSPDDFTLISRKDGDRSPALEPTQIAGQGALVVHPAAEQPGGDGTRTNGPIWGGVSVRGGNSGAKKQSKEGDGPEAKIDNSVPEKGSLLAALKEKILADKETKTPVEGLLYFALQGKLKPKDVSLIYKGPSGKLVMEFK
jgi:hypothetical protein